MSDTVNIAGRAGSLEKADKVMPFTKVRIYINNDSYVEAGNDNGRMLEIDNPFGTQQMVEDMLEKLTGKQYQPFEAESAQVDPAAEIGDGITISDVYSGLYKSKLTFSSLMTSDISAPFEEEIDREYKYQSETERKFAHQIDDVRASLIITQQNIEANVVRKQGPNETSFGWNLTDEFHEWYANGDRQNPVMKITASGLYVRGQIEASSGHIGGFKINATQISNYSSGNGVWISTEPYTKDGNGNPIPTTDPAYNNVFQVGSNFHVKNDGSIRATGGKIGGFKITATELSNWSGTYNNATGVWMSTTPYNHGSNANYKKFDGAVLWVGHNFWVTSDGSLHANNGTFTGVLEATEIKGNLVIDNQTYTPAAVGGGIGGGREFNNSQSSGTSKRPNLFVGQLSANNGCTIDGSLQVTQNCIVGGRFYVAGSQASWKSATIDGVTINYLGA